MQTDPIHFVVPHRENDFPGEASPMKNDFFVGLFNALGITFILGVLIYLAVAA